MKRRLNAFGALLVIVLVMVNALGVLYLVSEFMLTVRYPSNTSGQISMVEATYLGALWSGIAAKVLFLTLLNVILGIGIFISTDIDDRTLLQALEKQTPADPITTRNDRP